LVKYVRLDYPSPLLEPKKSETDMNESNLRFVDHPAPSIGLMTIMLIVAIGCAVVIPSVLRLPPGEVPPWSVPVIVSAACIILAILCLAFWLVYSTYYTLSEAGLTVKYGPSTITYRWDEFRTVYWRKGVFATKIGWVSVTPCVRLSNAVALYRKDKFWPLYLTPNDPRALIEVITLFSPELTKEVIL